MFGEVHIYYIPPNPRTGLYRSAIGARPESLVINLRFSATVLSALCFKRTKRRPPQRGQAEVNHGSGGGADHP